MSTLWLDLAGISYTVDDALTFGRDAALSVDPGNRYMHRVTGEFSWNGLYWWIENLGASTRLFVFGTNGARLELPPRTGGALPAPAGSVSFHAGPTPYQLLYRIDEPVVTDNVPVVDGEATINFGTSLSEREKIYLTTFALRRLRGMSVQLLSYAEVARIWGVSEKTIGNTLQRVRTRMKDSGVRGAESLEGLVDHLLAHGQIGLGSLAEIEQSHPEALPPAP